MDAKKIGSAIQILRRRIGYTQFDLADALCVTDKAVSKWERGISVPDIGIITQLAVILNCDVDNLLEGNISYLEEEWQGYLKIENTMEEINSSTMVYGKPLVYFSIAYFMLAGIKNIYISCEEEEKKRIEKYSDFFIKLGINIIFISDVFELSNVNTMCIEGFAFFYGANLTRYFQRAMAKQNKIVTLTINNTNKNNIPINYDNYKVIHYPDANTNCCSTNISFFPSNQISAIDISFEDLINQKRLYAEPMGNGMIQFQIESQEDILNASNFIQFVKNTMGTDIYNLTQIAKNRNLI